MNRNILKSIGAILAGFITVAILSNGTDFVLERTGFMKIPFYDNAGWIIILVIIYRSIYGVAGSYIAATLAQNRPMWHAMLLGAIGLVLTILGSIEMWEQAPAWYSILLVLLVLPCAWLGGKLRIKN